MNIVVLCGGISTEREVSINTGSKVCEALRSKGHNAVMVDVYFGTDKKDLFALSADSYDIEKAKEEISANNGIVEETIKSRDYFFGENVISICYDCDIVFMALHGENGENGKVQATFDLMGIKYTGSGCLGSAMAMDKAISKQVFMSNKIPTPKGVWLKKGESNSLEDIGMTIPCVVKPCCGGSSVGVTIVESVDDYQRALDESFRLEDEVVIEQYVKGREFSVGVIDGKALPIIEIIPKVGFYDYKNKYIPGMTDDVCPAQISAELTDKMQKIAVDVYNALKLESYGRVDVLMEENGDMYCLEANTLPGMTATSLLPQEAAVLGIDFPSLCDKLIEISLKKYN
ncbi:MAG: D-alanine--D-alanine ligase [Lachnospiraceae bacterium]|nr:D-alanine--D-alanine ligase [Lachnospiraceae bacterium]